MQQVILDDDDSFCCIAPLLLNHAQVLIEATCLLCSKYLNGQRFSGLNLSILPVCITNSEKQLKENEIL